MISGHLIWSSETTRTYDSKILQTINRVIVPAHALVAVRILSLDAECGNLVLSDWVSQFSSVTFELWPRDEVLSFVAHLNQRPKPVQIYKFCVISNASTSRFGLSVELFICGCEMRRSSLWITKSSASKKQWSIKCSCDCDKSSSLDYARHC